VRFTSIGPEASRRLNSRLSCRQARWSTIEALEIKIELGDGELAIRLEKRRITRDCLVQKVGRLQ
jgi:hypothetical protein